MILKHTSLILRLAAGILIIYAVLVLYIYMRKENILSIAKQEVKIKLNGDTVLVTGYGLGCARAREYADSLTGESIPNRLLLVEPIYSEKEYLHKRYGIFYPEF